MGRLKGAPARLARLPGRLGLAEVSRDQARDRLLPWRAWYKTKRWQRLRWSVLVRDRFICARCGRVEHESAQLVADHTVRHGGCEALFWDPENLQTLCKPCHDGAKQREERRGM